MADETEKPAPLKKFLYPFQKTETPPQGTPKAVEVVDPQTYYSALANAEDGFYPIGANGQWHGGIHFGSQTGGTLAQAAGIRCIADGEVIAYRIDSAYPTVAYNSCGEAKYSTGFALVRHRLQLPPAPAATGTSATPAATAARATVPPPAVATPAGPPTSASEAGAAPAPAQPTAGNSAAATAAGPAQEHSLVLYSLYMHLLNWPGYQDDANKARPAYWGSPVYVAGDKATDADKIKNTHIPEGGIGLNLRDADNKIAGFAPRGTKLKLGVEGKTKGYYTVTEVISGDVVPAGLTGAYAFKKQLTETAADPTADSVVVLAAPVAVKAGDLMGHLGEYQRYVDTNPSGSSCVTRPLVQLDVFSGEDVEGFIAKSRDRAKQLKDDQKSLLFIETGAKLALPTAADQTITETDGIAPDATSPKTGDWVKVRKGALQVVTKAGLDGYVKATRTYDNGSVLSRILDADGNAIELTTYNALPAADKAKYTQREVMVPSGDPLWVQRSMVDASPLITGRSMDAWSQFPLQASDTTGPQAAYPRVVGIKMLEKSATEADDTRWWQVTVGIADGSPRAGWAREKEQAKVRLCTPWDWPGFELVPVDTTVPATFYSNFVAKQPQTSRDEQGTLEAQGASAETAPLFDKLYDLIDLDDDKSLTPEEIRKALRQPWLAQTISRLITRYDSEWAGPMDKWNAIDPLIPETRKEDWTQEKKRIETLLWWDDVKGKSGFPNDPISFNFHPVALIANFYRGGDCSEEWRLDKIFLEVSEGALVLQGYVPKKNGVAIGQSGVTVSTGIDLGQQTKSGTKDVLDNYISEFGNPNSTDIDVLIETLEPYFSPLRKQDAIDKLVDSPISITLSEAELLADSFKFDFKKKTERMFNNNNSLKMKFKMLPKEAQTVVLDFSYQYGLSDSDGAIRRAFWGHVYKGEWQKLADWLVGKPDIYNSRRLREGKLVQSGIDSLKLPEVGDPCPDFS